LPQPIFVGLVGTPVGSDGTLLRRGPVPEVFAIFTIFDINGYEHFRLQSLAPECSAAAVKCTHFKDILAGKLSESTEEVYVLIHQLLDFVETEMLSTVPILGFVVFQAIGKAVQQHSIG
jgi:hypothetical protein